MAWFGKLAWGVVLGVAACTAQVGCGAEEGDDGSSNDEEVVASKRELLIDEDPSVLIEHPETLRALEERGFDLGTRLTGARMESNAAFASSLEGTSIIAAVDKDVAEAKQGDKQVGVGMAFSHRAFDAGWLRSKEASFELVAITNRLDRRHADPAACGEIHMVYRLAYSNKQASSRLPMTIMLVYPQPKIDGSCAPVASKWLGQPSKGTFAEKAEAAAKGPLAGLALAPKVETNFQLVRWPSTTRTDMGGHAEYSLRVFERAAEGLAPVRLDNTLREDLSDGDRAALAKWVRENLSAIDRGIAKLPTTLDGTTLLAEKAISVSPKGLARAQNRPFAVALGKGGEALGDVSLDGLSLATSKAALVRRLDTMSCNGCHQSQGIAGFHIVGHDRQEMSDINALVQGISAHTREQVAFRKKDLASVAGGATDLNPLPFAERALGLGAFDKEGGYGANCGLGDPGFAKWTCASGLSCSDINHDDVGICVTAGKGRSTGEACEESSVSFNPDPHADKISDMKVLSCSLPSGGAGRCVRSGGDPGGFPTGMCGGGCSKMGKVEGEAICGVAVPSGFNKCIGEGKPFETCTAGGPKAFRKACSVHAPCGPDYVCSAVPGAPAGVGACLPPYFIFQARVDGHLVGK